MNPLGRAATPPSRAAGSPVFPTGCGPEGMAPGTDCWRPFASLPALIAGGVSEAVLSAIERGDERALRTYLAHR